MNTNALASDHGALRQSPPQRSPQPIAEPQTAHTRRCADVLLDVLVDGGVRRFYGVPGGAIGATYDALCDRPELPLVHVRHETSAAHMAIGHTFVRPDELVCVLTTSGPGVTNVLTGLSSANAERVPMVVLAGEVPRGKLGRGALQEGGASAMDIVGMVRSVTRRSETIEVPEHGPRQLAAALAIARSECGPVLLSLPLDVALARIPSIPIFSRPSSRPEPNDEFLDRVAASLRNARRPVVLVGPDARPCALAIRRLTSRLRIPVMTTPTAKGLVPDDERGCLGVFGYGGHPSTREWLTAEPPDVVLVLGSSLSEVSTNNWSPLLQATDCMIQLDHDPRRIGVNYRVDLGFAGHWYGAIDGIDQRLRDREPWGGAPASIHRLHEERELDDALPLHPARVLRALQQVMPAETLYAADVGENLLFAIHHLRIQQADGFLAALEAGSMGSGLGSAVGAKAADPGRPVVAIAGDYAFQMYGMELATCAQQGWDVVFVIMNDTRMRMVEAGQTRIYGRSLPMNGPRIDFAAMARAVGAAGAVVETVADLERAVAQRPADTPLVLDCRIDPEASFTANARVEELGTFNEE